MFKTLMLAVCASISMLALSSARADDQSAVTMAMGYCADMENQINLLVDYTVTKRIPARDKDGMSYIFISSKPVFSVEVSKKAWLIVVVAAFGNEFNGTHERTSQVYMSDGSLMQNRQAYRIPASMARRLQQQVKVGQVGLEAMYTRIIGAMGTDKIPQF